MPQFTYFSLGGHKKLNEIVMVGSHDAGIDQGDANAQTQDLDIAGQAEVGVRIFDIRITAQIVKNAPGGDVARLVTYHGPGGEKKKNVIDLRTGQQTKMQVKNLLGGTYGQTLTRILADAATFVTNNPTEFLILKFDHCSNWTGIADAARATLGKTIYSKGGNLNERTLRDLAGSVIVLFSGDGIDEIRGTGKDMNIYGVRNLMGDPKAFRKKKRPKTYDDKFQGLQYCGKGGTSAMNGKSHEKKLGENIKKQTKKMMVGAEFTNPRVMGMMYWTTTGFLASIKERNDFIWNEENREKMIELFEARLPRHIDKSAISTAGKYKEFMPNFVMIDFADADKCRRIYNLNFVNALRLQQAMTDQTDVFGRA